MKRESSFRDSLSFDPSFSRAYLGEGIALLKEGRTDEALKELSKADPSPAEPIGDPQLPGDWVLSEAGGEAALEELRKAEECDPLDSTPHQLASADLQ